MLQKSGTRLLLFAVQSFRALNVHHFVENWQYQQCGQIWRNLTNLAIFNILWQKN